MVGDRWIGPMCVMYSPNHLAEAARQEPLLLERLREGDRVRPVVPEGAHEGVHAQLVGVAAGQKTVAA